MLTGRRLRRVQACGWLVALAMLVAWVFGGTWEPTAPAADAGAARALLQPAAGGSLVAMAVAAPAAGSDAAGPAAAAAAALLAPAASAQSPAALASSLPPPSPCPPPPPPPAQAGAPAALPPWPASAALHSSDGRAYRRLSLEALWAWSPERVTIVSGDSFRDRSPYVCDDDYGVGKARGCRFAASELVSPARVFAKLPHHMPQARQILGQRPEVKHVYVNGGGDTPLTEEETSALASTPSLLGFFSINVPAATPPSPRIMGIPLGVERTISPRGQFPQMYLKQRTGYNLAAKLCWAPVLAAEALARAGEGGGGGSGSGGDGDAWAHPAAPLLYMNFRTETNEGVRGPARAAFGGRAWVTDNVNAGDAVDVRLPGGGLPELPLEASLRALWRNHSVITAAPWFKALCGLAPVIPRGLDPALVPELALPGYPLFLKAAATAPYVLAPEGNGVSTHRAWEVMYAGAIAVVKEVGGMTDAQYRGLPAMMVREWGEVTPRALACYSVELLVKAAGLPAGGAGAPGGGVYPAGAGGAGSGAGWVRSREGIAALLDALDGSGTLSKACAGQMAAYAEAHPLSHTGFLSLEALDYEWWHEFIRLHTERLAGGG